jgi:hypothetical protein
VHVLREAEALKAGDELDGVHRTVVLNVGTRSEGEGVVRKTLVTMETTDYLDPTRKMTVTAVLRPRDLVAIIPKFEFENATQGERSDGN